MGTTSPVSRHPPGFSVAANTAADGIELAGDQLERLNTLRPAAGERHDGASMAAINR
jgi:hypothetical protein